MLPYSNPLHVLHCSVKKEFQHIQQVYGYILEAGWDILDVIYIVGCCKFDKMDN